jgi:leucine-rich repeat protein SHOC2
MKRSKLERLIEQAEKNHSEKLDLQNCRISVLPESIGKLSQLTSLDLYNNELTSLPESIGNLSRLTSLNLNCNRLDSLPASISNLINLKSLVLSCNQFTQLPFQVGDLPKLERLYLRQNSLTKLPKYLNNLSSLKEIYLGDNPWKDLSGLNSIPHLKRAYCFGSHLNSRYWIKLSYCKAEWILNEDNFALRQLLIEQIGIDEIIERLSCAHPDFQDKNVVKFELNLRALYLEKLSHNIGNIDCLTELDLSYNQLSYLPDSIGNLSNLVELDLGSNQLISLPKSIGKLKKIVNLNLRSNQLTNLPRSIVDLTNLTELHLSDNRLNRLPEHIGHLSNLNYLDLSNNQLTCLPTSIAKLSKLTHIDLRGNPWENLSILNEIPNLERVYCFGVNLPARYWTKLSEWQPEWLLDEDNVELRQRILAQVGYERICAELKAIELDTWREYTLLKIDDIEKIYEDRYEPIGTEPLVLLKMPCPSTAHIHILRVPPDLVSAEAAIIWVNHGIHPDNFAVQT